MCRGRVCSSVIVVTVLLESFISCYINDIAVNIERFTDTS